MNIFSQKGKNIIVYKNIFEMGEKMNIDNNNKKSHFNKNFYVFSLLIFIAFTFFCTRRYIPNEVSVFNNEKKTINISTSIFSVDTENEVITVSSSNDQKTVLANNSVDDGTVTVKFLGIPIKSTNVKVINSKQLIPSGESIGINIKTDGVMVLGTGEVIDDNGNSIKPWENKIKAKDIILEANGVKVNSKIELMNIIDQNTKLNLLIKRDNQTHNVEIDAVKSSKDNKNKVGIWVRDGTEGIGTLTYINPTTSKFGALGHGILDVDTNELMPVATGNIFESRITTINPGEKGSPGELIGQISTVSLGDVKTNTGNGIYGHYTSNTDNQQAVDIGLKEEIKIGEAYILCDIGNGIEEFEIYVENVDLKSTDEKGMVIKITDQRLLSKTHGIIQGMSGSPIIQNEKIIGAVTHVFVQDPAKGYGIFIENMLNEEKTLT